VDLGFTIDVVAHAGRGAGDDYLLNNVKQASTILFREKLALVISQRKQPLYRMLFL
jgi:hypothetical protein